MGQLGGVWTLLPDPLTVPINRPPGIPPEGDHSAFTTTRGATDTFVAIIL
jgi:hypothetical protein